jgi:7-cyano-7-deazaguanine synthase
VSPAKAVVLLSGGVDSTTALAVARRDGYRLFAISFRYGQRHEAELAAAGRIAADLRVERHLVVDVGLGAIGGSALTDSIDVPKHDDVGQLNAEIPVTYVPARNTVFLSLALAWCEVVDSSDIFVGVNAVDYSGYPDCRPEYITAFETMANLATKAAVEGRQHVRIHAPLMHLTKAEIVALGTSLGVDYALTHSCYDPDPAGRACGRCDSCLLRRDGFRQAGLEDPTSYQDAVAV